MLVSYNWIRELSGVDASPEELAKRLTFSGLEVEGVEKVGAFGDKIVVGEISSKSPHPKRDKLNVVEVDHGTGVSQVVCGASNCPGPGGRIVFAMPGARVGELEIAPRDLAGVSSHGMICSEEELGIGPDGEGILLLQGETDASVGTPIGEALGLGDWILDVGVTPNRPDALSHRGVARDVALLYGRKLVEKPIRKRAVGEIPIEKLAKVELIEEGACPRYAAAVVSGLKVGQSPFWLRYRLHTLGIRPISNLVDITNLILLEYGQPLHAFDLDKLAGDKVVIRKAEDGEKMKTLDGLERTFCSEDLLICDGEKPVAIAGVMGGEETGVTAETTRILLECAYFAPTSVRRTSKLLKLSSDASYRFERGVDPNAGPVVMEQTLGLVAELAGGETAPGIIDCYPTPIEPIHIDLRPSRFSAIMGFEVGKGRMAEILEGLGAEAAVRDDLLDVTVPTFRPDIEREIDLVEEIARIEGLELVPSELPRIRCVAPQHSDYAVAVRAAELMMSLGLQETINYSFVPEELLETLGMKADVVRIANPLNAERATMRTSLIPGLLENLKRAQSRFLPGVQQFEVAEIFHDTGEELPREDLCASALMCGPAASCWVGEEERSFDFYDMKGVVERFVLGFAGMHLSIEAISDISCMHPKRCCEVKLNGERVGFFGELHPRLLAEMKLPRGATVCELKLAPLWEAKIDSAAVRLPEFPPSVRDIALMVDEQLDSGPICRAISEACAPLARSVRLFDVYRGKGIEPGKKSLAFSIEYRANDRTLTDAEVDSVHEKAVTAISAEFDAIRR